MSNYRLSKGTTEHYTSLEELRAAWGKEPFVKRTKDPDKLVKQQENFLKHYRCKACGKPMTYIGGNMMTCTNEACKGIKVEREDKEGNKIVNYVTSYELLDERFADIANSIF